MSRTPRHYTPAKSHRKPLQSVGNRWKASTKHFPTHGATLLATRRHPGVASRGRRGEVESEHLPVTLGSCKALMEACQALPGTKPPKNPIGNRCKALEIVGRRPCCNFPAAGAPHRQPGAPQASQAGADEERRILGTSRSLRAAAGRLWRLVTPSAAPYPHETPSETVGKRWKASPKQFPGHESAPPTTRRLPSVASGRRGGDADSE